MLRYYTEKLIVFIISVFLFMLVVMALWQVFTRYILNDPSQYTDEALRFIMVWLAYLGIPYAFGITDKHMSLSILRDKFSGKKRLFIESFNYVAIVIFSGIVLVKGGYTLCELTNGQYSDSLNLPMHLVYSIMPISGVLIVIFKTLNFREVYCEIKCEKLELQSE